MSFTVNSMVFKVFLPILVGLAIFGTLNSIKVNSLDPNVDSLNDAIGELTRDVTFGDIYNSEAEENPDREKSRQEVREAILINTVMAQRCDFVPLLKNAEWKTLKSEDPRSDAVYFNYDTDNVGEPFEVSNQEGEVPLTCVGADSPAEVVKPPLDVLSSGPQSEQTDDMEGRFGRINFDVENTLVFEDPRIGSLGLYSEAPEDFGNFPDFWRNARTSFMLPAGLQSNECSGRHSVKKQAVFYPGYEPISGLYELYSGNNEDINIYNGGKRMIYAFRARMVNVPVVKESYSGPYRDLTLCGQGANSDLKKFLRGDPESQDSNPAKYILCENATGYIQSNAGSLDNSGESDVDSFDWVNGFGTEIVFPKLLVRNGADDCTDRPAYMADNGQIIGPEIGLGNGRKGCSFSESTANEEGRSIENWNGLQLECGLTEKVLKQQDGGNIDYYSTVWHTEEENFCLQDAEILGSYQKIKGSGAEVNPDGDKVSIRGETELGESTILAYSLNYIDDISRIDIEYSNYKSSIGISVNGENPVFWSGDAHREQYFEEILLGDGSSIEAEYDASDAENGPENGYVLSLKPQQSSASWRWYDYEEGNQQYSTEIDSIPQDANSIEFTFSGSTDRSEVEINSIQISGGPGC